MSEQKKKFKHTQYQAPTNKATSVDLPALYEQANAELGLQQTKRDQIITVYLTMFSFLLPFSISIQDITWQAKGFILLAAAIIGLLFACVIVRYRIYKEAYWLCCQSITMMMAYDKSELTEDKVQEIYYHAMEQKNGKYVLGKGANRRFKKWEFSMKNLMSAETLHYLIHSFITATLTGLSAGLISEQPLAIAIPLGIAVFAVMLLWLMWMYFKELIDLYAVLVDELEDSFKRIFDKAWFLHLF